MARTSILSREQSMDEWKKIIDECESSGLSQKEWCKAHSIGLSSYRYWKKAIKEHRYDECVLDRLTRDRYIKMARELCYPKQAIDDLNKAKNEFECEQILRNARKGDYDK